MLKESLTTELKREFTPGIIKSIIAFANTVEGNIYIGIDDFGNIVGINDTDEVMLQITNSIRDSIKPDISMFVSVTLEEIDEKTIIKVFVQKGTSAPYYIASKGLRSEGVYVRQGVSSVPATETLIRQMIKDTDGESFELTRSLNQNLSFEDAQKAFGEKVITFGDSQKKSLYLLNKDNVYTNIALLLSDQCPYTIKCAVFKGEKKEIFKDRKEFEGSLFKQLEEVYRYIDLNNRTQSTFDELKRIDKFDYPKAAIRETLLNAIIHRDYAYSDSTLVNIYDNRIEIVSIGGLVTGFLLEDVLQGVSVKRNPKLAEIFYRLDYVEAFGTGLLKIVNEYERFEVKPEFIATNNTFKVILPNTSSKTPNNNEELVLLLFNQFERINRSIIETQVGVSSATAIRLLKELTNKKIIIKQGQGRTTSYILNPNTTR